MLGAEMIQSNRKLWQAECNSSSYGKQRQARLEVRAAAAQKSNYGGST
jgi:hypothetical protein